MKELLVFVNMTVDDRFYWALVRDCSSAIYGIARIRRDDGSVHFVRLPFKFEKVRNPFSDLLKVGQKLYLIPKESDYMLIYDISIDEWKRVFIQVPDEKYFYKPIQKFSSAVAYHEYLYLFPCFYPVVVRYHFSTGEMEYLYECMKTLDKYPVDSSKGICDQVIVDKAKVYFFSKRYGMVLQFEMESCKIKILEEFGIEESFCAFADDGQYYWLIPYRDDSPIIRYSKKEKKKEYLEKKISGLFSGSVPFSCAVTLDGFVWLFPGQANMVLKIDTVTGVITEAEQFRIPCWTEVRQPEGHEMKFCFVKKIKDEIFAYDLISNALCHYRSVNIYVNARYYLLSEDIVRVETAGEKIYSYLSSI